ncbi:MAG: hypothetical protein AAF410_02980, partial [Pseudomonadota bacterium]
MLFRLIILALIVIILLYMFRHHSWVEKKFKLIISIYILIISILIGFAVKHEYFDDNNDRLRVVIINEGPVTGNAPVKAVNKSTSIQYTKGAVSLKQFMNIECSSTFDLNDKEPENNINIKKWGGFFFFLST